MLIFSSIAAKAKIDPRIGPIQGVQPKPKAAATVKLVQKMKGEIVECCFIIDLPDIGGRDRLENMGQKVFTLCEFEGK